MARRPRRCRHNRQEAPPQPPSAFNPGVPAELDAMVARALAKAPAERFQSASEFEAALAGLVSQRGQRIREDL